MKLLKSVLLVLCMSASLFVQAQTQVIAHRGFWDCKGSAENSITALQKAAEINVYGAEFDVQLTADGVCVVNHDNVIQGHKIWDTNFSKLRRLRLQNGERLSTLEQYLIEGKKHPNLKLILEGKNQSNKKREDQMVAEIARLIRKYNMEEQVEFISFSMNLCRQFVRLFPNAQVSFLGGKLSPKEIKTKGLNGIDYHLNEFMKHSEWIKEAHDLGMKVNSWTVNNEEDMRRLVVLEIDYLTTNNPLLAKEIVKE